MTHTPASQLALPLAQVIAYNNPVPVAVALIPLKPRGGVPELLGVVRGIAPGYGGVALPGGYVDEGESIEMAAAREVLEECRVHTLPSEWRLLGSHITPQNRVLVFALLTRYLDPADVDFDGAPTEEVLGLARICATTSLVFPSHQEMARLHLLRAG